MMHRPITLLGAASSIGIRPYEDGTIRQLDRAPKVLRDLGLSDRIAACDLGDVTPPPYRDVIRPAGRACNESEIVAYSRELAARVAEATADGSFALVLGGDCSIVLGCLLGVGGGEADAMPLGLIYIDAHSDFATPEESQTGSAASMCLALAVGRGDSPLAVLRGDKPLVRPEHVALLGRRDQVEVGAYGQAALGPSGILDIPHAALRENGIGAATKAAIARVAPSGSAGFWIHLDADVIDPSEMAAVDSPEPDGLRCEELAELLAPLVRDQRARGLEVTIYDPALDPTYRDAATLVALLSAVLGNKS
jgi:arginase